ncbi:MAG TPA: DUF2085 domain-containing protein [Thermoanaerobaculia bacterium]
MKRETLILGVLAGTAAAVILLLAVACTYAEAHGASHWWRVPFRVVCHGIPHRCLFLFGTRMPICARCTAIYIGLIAGVAAFLIAPWIHERLLRAMMWIAMLPMAVDGFSQLLRFRESTNILRIATGFPAAFFFVMWAMSAVERRHERTFTTS